MILSFDVGLKNLAFCILKESEIIDWEVFPIQILKGDTICDSIVKCLDNHKSLGKMLNCTNVVIEKQPSKNNQMKIIESLLNAYFVIKGKNDSNSSINKVIVYSAKHKLGNNTQKGKSMYTERKKLSVARTKSFLEMNITNSEFIKFFSESKKKDDLADSLLQGLAYVKCAEYDTLQNILVDFESKVIAKMPTSKQKLRGYSKSNLKYLLQNMDSIPDNMETLDTKIKEALIKFYGNNETLKNALKQMKLI